MSGPAPATIWHDVECGGYEADLALWEELAVAVDGPILELGCGTGRVALHLARRGHRVIGLDSDPELIAALRERGAGLAVSAVEADGRDFELGEGVGLALAPMQFMQLLPTPAERIACMIAVARHLPPGALLAAALVEGLEVPDDPAPPIPDVREAGGWVYSSLPTAAALGDGEVVLLRLRQTVSPAGELCEEANEIRLSTFPADQLEVEAAAARLRPAGRRTVPATASHVGSLVALLAREEG
ncbi:MAG TPA: class I SAM-dependent methyltransferase [Solirubrobacterales bacterium]|jgi:SAM-dependent methyltransferase